jgi:hypothetical protein
LITLREPSLAGAGGKARAVGAVVVVVIVAAEEDSF